MTVATTDSKPEVLVEARPRRRFIAKAGFSLLVLIVLAAALLVSYRYFNLEPIPRLDQEYKDESGKVINPSTQSMNRYFSTLRNFTAPLDVEVTKGTMSVTLKDEKSGEWISAQNIDLRFLVPLLPYAFDKVDAFDYANLMLAEYSRNSVTMSYQPNNDTYGYFNAAEHVFNGDDDYFLNAGALEPNARVKPLRFAVTNNCLNAGLWELSATDSVGEIYHSWFDMPRSDYYDMIRQVNGIEASDISMFNALRYKKDMTDTEVLLDRLRDEGSLLSSVHARINPAKEVGGYSTQDSRRKAQKAYFEVFRGEEKIAPQSFYDLELGDVFQLKKFVPPGVYSDSERIEIPFDPFWNQVEIREVSPKTQYPGGKEADDPLGYIEILVRNQKSNEAIVVGNLPVSLLVKQQDYFIPAFGVGIFMPSERIERRFLRLKDGPVPHYAYLMEERDGKWYFVNNHESGVEQVTIRPFEKNGKMHLRVTLIAYERILDLLEMEIPISEGLAKRIQTASSDYTPPLYRVYQDDNLI